MQESSKLEFYRNLKQEYKFENYLQIKDRTHKAALTKLRISAHKSHIEKGRWKKYNKDLKKYTNIPKDERRCQTCPNEVEDECHFLFNMLEKFIPETGIPESNGFNRIRLQK